MRLLPKTIVVIVAVSIATRASAQQPLLPPPPTATSTQPQAPPRVEARKEVTVKWMLGDQIWIFDDILSAYEPVKGWLEPPGTQGLTPTGNLADWKLRLAKEFEAGSIAFHSEVRGSPFKVVLLDADRTVINDDAPAQITMPSGKIGDTIDLFVALPDASKLRDVRFIRVERRTKVGF
jgi:hypothetical protein